MAELKELATLFKGEPPSAPKELKPYADKLEAAIKVAQIAMKQKGLDQKKYDEILEKGQLWAAQKLKTELKMKEFIDGIQKVSGGDRRSEDFKNAPNVTFDSKKTKAYIAQELLGLNPNQQREIRKLTDDGVRDAVSKAKKDREIPTRYSALIFSKLNEDKGYKQPKGGTNLSKFFGHMTTELEKYRLNVIIKSNSGLEVNYALNFDNKKELENMYESLKFAIKEYSKKHMLLKPPFNYVGGKSQLLPHIIPYLWERKTIVSPFMGGGAIELNLAKIGIDVFCYEYLPEISNLWIQILNNQDELISKLLDLLQNKIRKSETIDYKDTYKQMYNDFYYNGVYTDDIDKAAICWILLMSGYGAKLEGGNTGKHFFRALNPNSIERIANLNSYPAIFEHLHFTGEMSFEKSIEKHPDDFLYCDPPYTKSKLYGNHLVNPEAHEKFNHELLAEILNGRKNWILSYNDCPEIRKLYKNFYQRPLEAKYTLGSTQAKGEKKEIIKELLIFGDVPSK